MERNYTLPSWLDKAIYEDLRAPYETQNCSLNIIDMNKDELLSYVGTYLPRTYVEATALFGHAIEIGALDTSKTELTVFDFGCGSGGELIGLFDIVSAHFPHLNSVTIFVCEGNPEHLSFFDTFLTYARQRVPFAINTHVAYGKITSLDDMRALSNRLASIASFDIICTFKALCELSDKSILDGKNPYTTFLSIFRKNLAEDGICVMEDLTFKDKNTGQWLGTWMKMVDNFYPQALVASHEMVCGDDAYNMGFTVSHSRKTLDTSKVCWRILKKC